LTDVIEFLSKEVDVVIDRPLGSTHPKHGYIYPINYGYIPNTLGMDEEPIDAYVLGESEPLSHFNGYCIAIIRRLDDDDDKLIVVEQDKQFSDEQIIASTAFQEQFFESRILR